jgi:hypothetical protein
MRVRLRERERQRLREMRVCERERETPGRESKKTPSSIIGDRNRNPVRQGEKSGADPP